MTRPWLAVVGIGEDGYPGLGAAARGLIDEARILIGGARHLDLVPRGKARRIAWGRLADDLRRIEKLRGQRVSVLASGDPMWFGIGATLARRFPADEMTIVPHPGAFSLAAARLGWPLAETACLSVHGRPLDAVAMHLYPGARLLVLAETETTAAELAALLRDRGFGRSAITALERLGGPRETIGTGVASRWRRRRCDPLTTVAVEAVADDAAIVRSRVPGLPEEAFLHDGQITQHEIRAAALAALAPWPGALLWDIGAGSGSVAIEWARAGDRHRAPGRAARLHRAQCSFSGRAAARDRRRHRARRAPRLGQAGRDLRRRRDLERCPARGGMAGPSSRRTARGPCGHRRGRSGAGADSREARRRADAPVHRAPGAGWTLPPLAPPGARYSI